LEPKWGVRARLFQGFPGRLVPTRDPKGGPEIVKKPPQLRAQAIAPNTTKKKKHGGGGLHIGPKTLSPRAVPHAKKGPGGKDGNKKQVAPPWGGGVPATGITHGLLGAGPGEKPMAGAFREKYFQATGKKKPGKNKREVYHSPAGKGLKAKIRGFGGPGGGRSEGVWAPGGAPFFPFFSRADAPELYPVRRGPGSKFRLTSILCFFFPRGNKKH